MKPKDYKLRVPGEIVELVRGMHPELKKKMRAALASMMEDPYEGKVLKNELEGLRSFRARRFRIIYRIAKRNQIEIVAIGPRKTYMRRRLELLAGNNMAEVPIGDVQLRGTVLEYFSKTR